MKRNFLLISLLAVQPCFAAPSDPMKVEDIVNSLRPRSRVLVQGTIVKQINFDTYALNDGTGDVILDVAGLRHDLKNGDEVLAFGKYRGRSSYRTFNGEIQVTDLGTPSDTAAVKALGEKFAKQRPILKDNLPAAAATKEEASPPETKTVESRLEELEKLRSKNLINANEYHEQRERILNDL